MNEFERAIAKRLKNAASMQRSAERRATLHLPAKSPVEELESKTIPIQRIPEVPKENKVTPLHMGVVGISVQLPTGNFEFAFVKDNVLQNVPRNLLTKEVFKRVIEEGLRPILGGVREA